MKLNKKINRRDFWSLVSTVQGRRSCTMYQYSELSEIVNTFVDN